MKIVIKKGASVNEAPFLLFNHRHYLFQVLHCLVVVTVFGDVTETWNQKFDVMTGVEELHQGVLDTVFCSYTTDNQIFTNTFRKHSAVRTNRFEA